MSYKTAIQAYLQIVPYTNRYKVMQIWTLYSQPPHRVLKSDIWFVGHEVEQYLPMALKRSTVARSPPRTPVRGVDISSACEGGEMGDMYRGS